ncbi:MAG: helicase-related protein [Anaerobutyricum sp.]
MKPGDALIVFSKRSVINVAAELQAKIACSMIYGALPYETRKAETERFLSGETQVVIATDAIGMELNLPVKGCISGNGKV